MWIDVCLCICICVHLSTGTRVFGDVSVCANASVGVYGVSCPPSPSAGVSVELIELVLQNQGNDSVGAFSLISQPAVLSEEIRFAWHNLLLVRSFWLRSARSALLGICLLIA